MADSFRAPSEDRLRKEFQAMDTGGYLDVAVTWQLFIALTAYVIVVVSDI